MSKVYTFWSTVFAVVGAYLLFKGEDSNQVVTMFGMAFFSTAVSNILKALGK